MTDKDIVEELRGYAWPITQGPKKVMLKGADEIDRLRAENKRLRNALIRDSSKSFPAFLDWVADRFVFVYGESPNIGFVQSLREHAKRIQAALNTEESSQ